MRPPHTLLTLLSVSSTALAAPIPSTSTNTSAMDPSRLEDLTCQCLSISSDPLTKPTLCSALESHKLNWYTASSLAADHDLAIEYASKSTISRIVDTERVLPQNMLESIKEKAVFKGDARPRGLVQVRNVLVCGFGEEMRGVNGMGGVEAQGDAPEYHFVGCIGAGIMVLVVVYVLVEHVWSRFFAQGAIKLEGDEKTLIAETAPEAEESHEEKSGDADES